MPFALLNIDSGLFLCGNNGWTVDLQTAIKFQDVRDVYDAARVIQIKNPAAALLTPEGAAGGFFWLDGPGTARTPLTQDLIS